MKTLLLLLSVLTGTLVAQSQVEIYSEDFGSGCNQGQLASSATLASGSWSASATGQNLPDANEWYVSAMENGMAAGECGASCENNQTLHVSNSVHRNNSG